MTLLGTFALWAPPLRSLVRRSRPSPVAGRPAGDRAFGRRARSTPSSRRSSWRRSRSGRASSPRLQHRVRLGLHVTEPAVGYIFSAFWAGQKGSLLFWAVVLSLFAALAQVLTPRRYAPLMPYVAGVPRRSSSSSWRHAVRGESVRAPVLHAGGRSGAEPAAAEPRHGDPPAHAVPGLCQHHDPLRLRHGRAALAQARCRVAPRDAAAGRWCPGCSSRSGSRSGCGGPTSSWAGAATGPGTRWRTPASCRGSR